ncbi:hypothetical protein ID866_7468 [Astraeus odoratus]|nr:hypothetical protein ID866_7468 [Astraeus odoratus]
MYPTLDVEYIGMLRRVDHQHLGIGVGLSSPQAIVESGKAMTQPHSVDPKLGAAVSDLHAGDPG